MKSLGITCISDLQVLKAPAAENSADPHAEATASSGAPLAHTEANYKTRFSDLKSQEGDVIMDEEVVVIETEPIEAAFSEPKGREDVREKNEEILQTGSPPINFTSRS